MSFCSAVSTNWIQEKWAGQTIGLFVANGFTGGEQQGRLVHSQLPALLSERLIAHHWRKTVPGNPSSWEKCIP
ncbi:hypothetical protein CesoFtcFv8_007505 [Champsocephalus esox]|uniref:Uncharacterized protein n=1 Tax=Champsocephalus esox TaxID=159716 RepID=A0AAN8H4Y2_9TELE|nr:hypothetical protein CesoFtcFv8_007505 [Champsocephalus esox]